MSHVTEGQGPPGERGHARGPRLVLVALSLVVFTFSFQQTAVIPVIPTIGAAFHAPPEWSAWLLSAYLMVATVLTPAFGRLADLHGHSRMLLASMAAFFAGSVGAVFAPGLATVIVCRAAQGAGGAILPLSFAILRRHLPDRSVGPAIATVTGAFGLGSTAGFATGGLMAQAVSWRLVFGAGAVLVAAGIGFMLWAVPRPGGAPGGRFDAAGAAWLAGASLAVLLALTLGVQSGWAAPAPIGLLALSAVAAAMWVRAELHGREPLIDLRVLRSRAVAFMNAGTAGLGWARFTSLLLIPELVRGPGGGHYGFGAGPLMAGMYLVPSGLGLLVGGPVAGRLGRWMRPGQVAAAGLVLVAAAAAVLAGDRGSPVVVLACAGVLGLGGGLATQASSVVVTRDVPPGAVGASASLNSMLRRFSGGIGGQVSTVILASVAVSGTASPAGFEGAFAAAGALALAGAALAFAAPAAGRAAAGAARPAGEGEDGA